MLSLQGQGQWVASMTEIVSGLCQLGIFLYYLPDLMKSDRAYLIRRQWIRLIKQITENQLPQQQESEDYRAI